MSRELAILSLREIIMRALYAVKAYEADQWATDVGYVDRVVGWDLEFAQMSSGDQADWLIHLFSALTNDEVESIDEALEGVCG